MKPLLLFCCFLFLQQLSAQSLDYISVRKKNGKTLKNFYTGSHIFLQRNDGSYLQGPVQNIRNDSLFLTLYDIRAYPTPWGGYVRDTITTTIAAVPYKDIQRIHLNTRKGFFQRNTGLIMMLAGGGYLVINVLNGALYEFDSEDAKRIGIAAGIFAIGFLLHKLMATDGFSKKKHHIVYVDL